MNDLRIFVTFRWAASENNVFGTMTSKDTLLDQMRVSIDEISSKDFKNLIITCSRIT